VATLLALDTTKHSVRRCVKVRCVHVAAQQAESKQDCFQQQPRAHQSAVSTSACLVRIIRVCRTINKSQTRHICTAAQTHNQPTVWGQTLEVSTSKEDRKSTCKLHTILIILCTQATIAACTHMGCTTSEMLILAASHDTPAHDWKQRTPCKLLHILNAHPHQHTLQTAAHPEGTPTSTHPANCCTP
jgi:hypothetical protein